MGFFQKLFSRSPSAKVAASTFDAKIDYYKSLGFFPHLSKEEIERLHREDWGKELTIESPWDEVFLLKYDTTTTWTGDPEADVCQGNEVYAETLQAWAKITNGQFAPGQIEETWQAEEGPIAVSFLLGERRVTLEPKYCDDWIDLDILSDLNRVIESTGKRFNCAVDGNFCLVLFLTPEVEARLRRERNFPFALS